MIGCEIPVTAREWEAARAVFDASDDSVTKSELRGRIIDVVQEIRESDGDWEVLAESWDMPGAGVLISTHSSEAEALIECRRLNRKYDGDAGMYTHRPVPA